MIDTHSHSFRSDGSHSPEEMALGGIANGLTHLVITDHFDVDVIVSGEKKAPDFAATLHDIERINEKYAGQIQLHLGIELGQGYLEPEFSKKTLEQFPFEFVIASTHNLENEPDMWCYNYLKMTTEQIHELYSHYIQDLRRGVLFPGVNTLGHVTYPNRYIFRQGLKDFALEQHYDEFRELFHIMIETGVAMEINTSQYREGHYLPADWELASLYMDCGGTRFTIGSDAHKAPLVGTFCLDEVHEGVRKIIEENVNKMPF